MELTPNHLTAPVQSDSHVDTWLEWRERVDFALCRVMRVGRDLFDALPRHATVQDYARAIVACEPIIPLARAVGHARWHVDLLRRPPSHRYRPPPASNPNVHDCRVEPTELDFARYAKAVAMREAA